MNGQQQQITTNVFADYIESKADDEENGTNNCRIELRNGTPAFIQKVYHTKTGRVMQKSDPKTGKLVDDCSEIGFDIPSLTVAIATTQSMVDNLKAVRDDAQAVLDEA